MKQSQETHYKEQIATNFRLQPKSADTPSQLQLHPEVEWLGAFPMSLPKLSDQQIARAIQQVATYIEQQRQIYRGVAAPLDGQHTRAMQPFFSASALDSTRVTVLSGQRVSNPPFYVEFIKMGFEAGFSP